jgi:hypothetical protein
MKKCLALVVIALLATGLAPAQDKLLIGFDGEAAMWTTGQASPDYNKFVLTDNFDDYVEGIGSMQVDVAYRYFAASWGSWTDAGYAFATTQDLSQYDDIRFWVKIIQKPVGTPGALVGSKNRTLQFTMDLFEGSPASGEGPWRYQEDLDIWYTPHRENLTNPGWFEFIVPLKNLRLPTWVTPADGVLDLTQIYQLNFGVHGDSTATDSIVVLFDNLRATKSEKVIQLQAYDGTAGLWSTGAQLPINKFELTDNFDDYLEGIGSMKVDVALRQMGASWGTWTDAQYVFPSTIDATGATDLRFMIKVLDAPKVRKTVQFSTDLYDSTAEGVEDYRWVNGGYYGIFYNKAIQTPGNGWYEIVVPLMDMMMPSWWSPGNSQLDLNSIIKIGFGVHGDSTGTDSVAFLVDDLRLTKVAGASAVEHRFDPNVAKEFSLNQNYPNPFNPSTNIRYTLPASGPVTLKVYDITGRLAQTIFSGDVQEAGRHDITVDLRTLSSGVYYCVLEQSGMRLSKSMMLLK